MPSRPRNSAPAWPAAGAAAYAAAELAAGLLVGRFFDWGRAEALLFFAFRPWLLLAAALLVASAAWRERASFYVAALALAGFSQSLLLLALGGEPWREMLRGWAAGAALALILDFLVQLGGRLAGRAGRAAAALAAVLLFVLPGAMRPYEAIALGRTGPSPAPTRKPALLLMTGLPLVWGETGPFDPASRPAAAYLALRSEFAVRPIDYVDSGSLARARLLLLAQPRMLEPAELVALDRWVRGGGRALILADPALEWPTRLAPGDLRRPPPASLLAPLLGHWGLRLEPPAGRGLAVHHLRDNGEVRRLAVAAAGRFVPAGESCRAGLDGLIARCAVGRGRALLVADADLMRDDLWTAPGPRGAERHARRADNPLVLAGWLDRLAGLDRARSAGAVDWLLPGANRRRALLLAALPILLGLAAFPLLRRRAARPTGLSTGGAA